MDSMGKVKQDRKRLLTVPFSKFDKWFVSFYLNPNVIQSNYAIEKLSKVIVPSKIRIKKNEYDGVTPVVGKISFNDGKIHIRPERKTGMDMYLLTGNELLVSKINFHQGAVALNKEGNLVCTTHYQPYTINSDKILGEYLVFTLRSKPFQNFIKYLRADGIKNEATYEFIGDLNIPLPSLKEQEKIIDTFQRKIKYAEDLETEAKKIFNGIDDYLFNVLGLKGNANKKKKNGLTTVSFRHLSRWAVDYVTKFSQIESFIKGKFEVSKLKELIDSYQYGLSEKSSQKPVGIPMLRMNNIINSELDIKDLKYIRIDDLTKKKFLLKKGDLLFNRTNSKELVGKTAIFNEDGEYTFASYLIRVKLDTSKVNIEYINYLFNSPILQFQKDMISRKILGQANINAQEMQDFLFPIPPLPIQDEIVSEIKKMKDKVKTLKRDAEVNRKLAIQEFETKIFN
jgi:type I restriction enzyme, S subunit